MSDSYSQLRYINITPVRSRVAENMLGLDEGCGGSPGSCYCCGAVEYSSFHN